MAEFKIKKYSFGQWSDATLPEWTDKEDERAWLKRVGFNEYAEDKIGCEVGLFDGLEIFSREKSEEGAELPEYLVCITLNDTFLYVGVDDHLNLLLLCRDFAPLLQLFYVRSVFDALFQDTRGNFDIDRLDRLRDFLR